MIAGYGITVASDGKQVNFNMKVGVVKKGSYDLEIITQYGKATLSDAVTVV